MCGGEGAERAAGGGVLDPPSPSATGPEPLRTEPRRSANFAAAEFRRERGNMEDTMHLNEKQTTHRKIVLESTKTSRQGEIYQTWGAMKPRVMLRLGTTCIISALQDKV